MNDDRPERRPVPQSELQFNQMQLDPEWGGPNVNQTVKKGVTERFVRIDSEGKPVLVQDTNGEWVPDVVETSLWDTFNFFTRDFRVSNLNKEEYPMVVWWSKMCAQANKMGLKRSMSYCLTEIIPPLELSQSRNGFLRKNNVSVIQNSTQTVNEPRKRLFSFGGSKQ